MNENIKYWVYLGMLGVAALEVLAGRHRGIYKRNDVLTLIGCAVLNLFFSRPAAALAAGAIMTLLLPAYRNALADMPVLPSFVVLLLIIEFLFYWVHRAAHNSKFKFLWKMHRTHHSAPYVNVTLIFRVNPFWIFVLPTTWVLGVAFYLGLTVPAALTMLVLYSWSVLTHCNFRWDDWARANPKTAWLMHAFEYVFVSPGIHHTHHGYGKDGKAYRNFGNTLSIWDRLFGTLHIPQGRPFRYGLPGSNVHWMNQILYPLLRKPIPLAEPVGSQSRAVMPNAPVMKDSADATTMPRER